MVKPKPHVKAKDPPTFVKPQSLVTIIASGQKFVVHKELICHSSPFFDRAFNGSFLEGQTQEMKLEDVEASRFGIFVHWLYTRKVLRNYDDYSITILDLVTLWMLGDRWCIPAFQNTLMRQLDIDFVLPGSNNDLQQVLAAAYESVKTTPLQEYFLDTLIYYVEEYRTNFSTWADLLPDGMLREFINKDLRRRWDGTDSVDLDVENYLVAE